jgi:hypothetical protein
VYNAIGSAHSTLDMTMYELVDNNVHGVQAVWAPDRFKARPRCSS